MRSWIFLAVQVEPETIVIYCDTNNLWRAENSEIVARENVDLKIHVKTDKNVIVIPGITAPKYRYKVMAKHKLLHGIYKPETQNDLFVLNKINFFLNISSKSCDKFRLVGDIC